MELENEFEVAVALGVAWAVLTDLERIAPCLPGAELQGVDGDEYRGVIKVKVGPVIAEYRGVAHFVERDERTHRAVLYAEGRETRGQGNANATIAASLESSERGTRVFVRTDLSITGRAAQFGKGVLADVSTRLLGQFVENLEGTVLNAEAGETPLPKERDGEAFTVDAQGKRTGSPTVEPVNLFDIAMRPIGRRLLRVVGGFAVVAIVIRLTRRRS